MTSTYFLNILYSTYGRILQITPLESFTKKKPDLKILHEYGSEAFMNLPNQNRTVNLSSHSILGILVEYSPVTIK